MTLDPQCQAVLDAAAKGKTAFDAETIDEARTLYASTTKTFAPETEPMAGVDDVTADGPHGPVPIRIYKPDTAPAPAPAMVFYHGGGFVVGDLRTHEHVCEAFAQASGALVLSVDYRLGPEHRFPAAVDDAMTALQWAADNADTIGADRDRIGVGGDSAGGNLAAVASILARDAGGPKVAFQWLAYPTTDMTANTESRRSFGEGYLLSTQAMDFFEANYFVDLEEKSDPRASPQFASSHSDLPPALIQTAGFDPLRDEAKVYAETLEKAGVAVEYVCHEGMIHGFMRMGAIVDEANRAIEHAAKAFRKAVG